MSFKDIEVVAWRGASHAHQENTLEAVLAVPPFVTMQEIDTRLTSDGVLIAYHSPTMRVHGDPRSIADIPWNEIKDKCIRKRKQEYRIPVVDELLQASPLVFMLHVKREAGIEDYVKASDALSRPVFYHSNSEDHLRALHGRPNTLGLFKSIYTPADEILDFVDGYMCGHKAFMPVSSLEDWWIEKLREHGKMIYVFAGMSEQWMEEVVEFDVDGFLTGRFDRAARVLGIDIE